MFCPNCGKQMADNQKFCGNCGWSVGSDFVSKRDEAVKGTKDNKFYFFAMVFMLISILIAWRSPAMIVEAERQKQYFNGNGILQNIGNTFGTLLFGNPGTETYQRTVKNPFRFNGMASLLAVILYSIILYRNKNTLGQFDKNNIDKRLMVLHALNLIFLVTVCSLFTTDSTMYLPFMRDPINPIFIIALAMLLSAVSMSSLSGIFWIIAVVAVLSNLKQFNDWEGYSAAYVICAYVSIVIQVLILRLFNIDLQQLKQDFMAPAKHIKGDVQATIETGSKAVNAATSATKAAVTATTGIPVAAIPSDKNKSNNNSDN